MAWQEYHDIRGGKTQILCFAGSFMIFIYTKLSAPSELPPNTSNIVQMFLIEALCSDTNPRAGLAVNGLWLKTSLSTMNVRLGLTTGTFLQHDTYKNIKWIKSKPFVTSSSHSFILIKTCIPNHNKSYLILNGMFLIFKSLSSFSSYLQSSLVWRRGSPGWERWDTGSVGQIELEWESDSPQPRLFICIYTTTSSDNCHINWRTGRILWRLRGCWVLRVVSNKPGSLSLSVTVE